jgi:predicted PurR-regulated permease PerM
VIGVLTALGLWLLGVELALTLGLLAALLTFIPNLGPVLALVPAVLLALMHSPTRALYVTLLYLAIQTVESYVLTPLVQRRTVSLSPALTITAQVALGVLLGGLGLVLATPLTILLLVLIQMLYIEDTLGDSVKVPGH